MIAQLVESREIAPDVRHFVFEVPEVQALAYQPGQFVSLSQRIGEKTITRAYSVSGLPAANRFELCLNRVQDGLMSPHLFDMAAGQAVDMKGPLGTFVWREDPVGPSILVATGTGIAPFRGMLHKELGKENGAALTLIFGTRVPETILYRAEFEEMEARHSRFKFLPTLTRADESWTGARGRVHGHLLAAVGDRRDYHIYCCGMKAMVDEVRQSMKDLGFDRRRIIYERYD